MFGRYQVRIRNPENVHMFSLRLNAVRTTAPDPKAARYRAALHLAIVGFPSPARRTSKAASMIGALEHA